MIPSDFEYYRPHSITEALQLYSKLYQEEKNPIYYGGGTEIITLGRFGNLNTYSIIDIKEIPECNVLGRTPHHMVLGAALTLTRVSESNVFPLLSKTASRVADHTARNKITLGGNIAGEICYREAVLPFLLADSTFGIVGIKGMRYVSIHSLFIERLRLNKGEFLLQVLTDIEYIGLPFYSVKKRKLEKVDYPVITLAALKKGNEIRMAFSGLCAFPFRSTAMEIAINNNQMSVEDKIENTVLYIPAPVLDDIRGSRDYRLFVLRNILRDMLEHFEGGIV
ncbi:MULTISPECIES: FAD binding domain-containing protein [Bacillus cereus group]|uniref:FAD binding domain-containing protein n=1 Tax=Bacillus cereus group TaxID=86661 RepID=UPI000BEC2A26|nr:MULTISPECIES: FAD binding domain-containing protein [Bacillus cereus group]MBE4942237.1 FAD binding domain-containing protein [Bacillus thuringiensis]MCU5064586.1 FAD binding domain-containing protein [Bacillus cereus]MCU5243323.1 FAD binding domain-containing protein [Bacillus cereus]MEB9946195.1 FAD binding domain-containing protein [Bacillus cereus]PDZ54007.1 xanthine dehydrogenase [Bacillus cereus]